MAHKFNKQEYEVRKQARNETRAAVAAAQNVPQLRAAVETLATAIGIDIPDTTPGNGNPNR